MDRPRLPEWPDRETWPEWETSTPHPERPALADGETAGSGTALDRVLTALAGLAFAALILRAFLPF